MKLHFLAKTLCIALSMCTAGCSFIADAVLENAFGSDKARRQKQYENRGIDAKRASRLAFEDEVWGGN